MRKHRYYDSQGQEIEPVPMRELLIPVAYFLLAWLGVVVGIAWVAG